MNIVPFCCRLFGCIGLLVIFISSRAQDSVQVDSETIAITPDTVRDRIIDRPTRDKNDYFDPVTNPSQLDSIHPRTVSQQVIDSFKKRDEFWYADKIFRAKKAQQKSIADDQGPEKLPSRWLNLTSFVIIIVIFVGVLLWYLFQANIIRRRKGFKKPTEAGEQFDDDNIFEIPFDEELSRAIQRANYRLAIRLLFLRLLKTMSEKNIIEYKQGRTNFDYLVQLRSTDHYPDFFRLTRNYEYAWYGKFDVSETVFGTIKNDFEKFDRKLA